MGGRTNTVLPYNKQKEVIHRVMNNDDLPESWQSAAKTRGFYTRSEYRKGSEVKISKHDAFSLLMVVSIIGVVAFMIALFSSAKEGMGAVAGSFCLMMAAISAYMLPTFAAILKKHRNIPGIAILNIALGWTVLGWIGALIWAIYEEKKGGS